jgi:hypothetical protein
MPRRKKHTALTAGVPPLSLQSLHVNPTPSYATPWRQSTTQSSALSQNTSDNPSSIELTPEKTKKDARRSKKSLVPTANPNGPENWQYPHAMDNEILTFINHGCVLDWQAHPLYPNKSTTFFRPAGTSITKFGAVGFSRISSNGAKLVTSDWKVI